MCFKVPTGGGKTLLACAALKHIFEGMQITRRKAVVWLVPSNSILEQTLKNLQNPDHDYRRQINFDFSSRVEVYKGEQAITGTVDYFTLTEYDGNIEAIQLALNTVENLSWAINSVQYEEDTNLIHYEWRWSLYG